jgi:tetratricopeptide (TPR) repeat protein
MADQSLPFSETRRVLTALSTTVSRSVPLAVLAACAWLLLPSSSASTRDVAVILKEALAAETQFDSRGALALFREADAARPNDAFILQKISKQLSDATADTPDVAEKKRLATEALAFAQRAVALAPENAVNVLSLAICHGKLATYSDTRTKVEYSRLVKEEAERALALDPNYDWAYHVLGRWNYEVASLSGATRFFVRVVYGKLPDASCERGIAYLKHAVELSPTTVAHQLELGFAYLACGDKTAARAQFIVGLAQPSREKYDDDAKERARQALDKLH